MPLSRAHTLDIAKGQFQTHSRPAQGRTPSLGFNSFSEGEAALTLVSQADTFLSGLS